VEKNKDMAGIAIMDGVVVFGGWWIRVVIRLFIKNL